jgi:cation-transporting ATPase 13A1
MTSDQLSDAIAFEREQAKLEEAGEEAAEGASTHKPNLLNTVVFLVETSQQVSVMLVNYKGRPWMRGATENPALLYSLGALVASVVVAAWEIVPLLNSTLGLVALPTDQMRYELLALIATTLAGSFAWDRLCVALFAPRIFRAQLRELFALSLGDFWGPNATKYIGGALAGALWLYYTEGNMLLLGIAYFVYKRVAPPPAAAAAAAAGAPPPAAVGTRPRAR